MSPLLRATGDPVVRPQPAASGACDLVFTGAKTALGPAARPGSRSRRLPAGAGGWLKAPGYY